jgi:hypothetical protein
MNVEQAFAVLGLPTSATVEEIDRRYRDVMRTEHPDQGGDQERAIQLNVARGVARKAAEKSQETAAVAAKQAAKAAAEAHKAAERARRKGQAAIRMPLGNETQAILARMREERTRPLALARTICGVACIALALIAVLASPDLTHDARFVPHSYLWMLLFGLAAFIFGCCTSIVSSEIRRAGRRIESLTEILETPAYLRATIEDMLMELVNRAPVGRKKLEEDVEKAARQAAKTVQYDPSRASSGRLSRAHLAAVVFAVSPADMVWRSLAPGLTLPFAPMPADTCEFGRLFVARGVEGGFIREQQSMLRGAAWTGYVISVPTSHPTTVL